MDSLFLVTFSKNMKRLCIYWKTMKRSPRSYIPLNNNIKDITNTYIYIYIYIYTQK